jgi:hypothetical protein
MIWGGFPRYNRETSPDHEKQSAGPCKEETKASQIMKTCSLIVLNGCRRALAA